MLETDPGRNAFANVAAFYEALFDADARLAREGALLRAVYAQCAGDRVADIACGTGVHALFFAGLGATVDAFDLSEEMVAHAHATRPHDAIVYRRADMRAVSGGPWDLAVCLGNSLALLPGEAALTETFRAVCRGLRPGGLFLAQVLNFRHPAHTQARHTVSTKSWEGVEITGIKSMAPHGNETLLALNFFAFSEGRFQTASDCAVIQHVHLETLESCARAAGLRPCAVYGGYDESIYSPETSTDLLLLFSA